MVNPTSVRSATSLSPILTWSLKPAFGSGRESREKVVEAFFRSLPTEIYGRTNKMFDEVKEGNRYKCRLLFPGDKAPKAIVVFRRDLTDRFESFGASRCLEMKIASPLLPEDKKDPTLYSTLIEKAKEEALELKAHSIVVTLPKIEKTALDIFQENHFRTVGKTPLSEEGEDGWVLALTLDEKNGIKQGKRMREEEIESKEEPVKKTKMEAPLQPPVRKQPSYPVQRPASSVGSKPLGITLKKIYIHKIREGKKTIEGRIDSGMFRNIRAGSLVRFFYFANAQDDVVCKVKRVTKYASFTKMLENEGHAKCVPEASSLKHASDIYDAIPGYAEKAKVHGVVAIELELHNERR